MINARQWEGIVTAAIRLLSEVTPTLRMQRIDTEQESFSIQEFALDLVRALKSSTPPSSVDQDAAKIAAVYLTFSIVPTHLESAYELLARDLHYEANIMVRSLAEALDLVDLFSRDECKPSLVTKWLGGDIIPNRESRNDSSNVFFGGKELVLAPEFFANPEARRITAQVRAKYYAILSKYVHHTSGSVVDAICYRTKSTFEVLAFNDFNNQLVRGLSYFLMIFGGSLGESKRKQVETAKRQIQQMFFDDPAELSALLAKNARKQSPKRRRTA